MDDNVIHVPQEDIEIIDASEYSEDLTEYFRCHIVEAVD